ncbi:EamA family transporter [Flavobacterium psychrotrophum]|uniref:EamA family transporter n=1 Tax=Flavobacterium psychrotrophum TaxID=2294119 RepID=UPI000E31A374|nr:EamA family transporter [Flavobacterium psychrotrophum]
MRSKYYLAAITAFAIWGMFSFVLRPLHDYPAPEILFYRIFTCVPFMVLGNVLFRRKAITETKLFVAGLTPTRRRNLGLLLVLSSLMLSANWFFFIYVMNYISVKAASFSYLVCPLLTTVFAFFILKERLTTIQWVSIGISVLSCVLLSLNGSADLFYSLLVAGSYALYLVIQKKFSEVDKFILLSLQILITALMLLPFYIKYSGPLPKDTVFYTYIAIIAVGFTIIPMLLNLFAIKVIASSTQGILMYINPIIGFLLAAFYYKEEIAPIQIVAYSLIAVAIIVFNIGSYFKSRKI